MRYRIINEEMRAELNIFSMNNLVQQKRQNCHKMTLLRTEQTWSLILEVKMKKNKLMATSPISILSMLFFLPVLFSTNFLLISLSWKVSLLIFAFASLSWKLRQRLELTKIFIQNWQPINLKITTMQSFILTEMQDVEIDRNIGYKTLI